MLPDKVVNPDYYIDDDNNLIITAGKDGVIVDEQEFKKELSNAKHFILLEYFIINQGWMLMMNQR